ncbi:uncharacterized protein LOC131681282 [Topomyia yanbarensis]|uniref:uncharacterized protein LOC131681282 n=1 Tax=Topomyia yanbarensis TaxID=2498891 RepID=UPI00273C860C|nr:uncharacterized protein LOC131681282 [Topomyia yanbarensis]
MPIVKESERSKSCPSFNILSALFGGEDSAEAIQTSSGTTQDQDFPELSKSEQTLPSIDNFRTRLHRASSVHPQSLMVQSFRKLSTSLFEAQSHTSEDEPQKLGPRPSEFLQQLETKQGQQLEAFNKFMENFYTQLMKLGSMTVHKPGGIKTAPSIASLLDQITTTRVALSNQRRKLIAVFRELEYLNRRNSQLDDQIKNIRLDELHDLQVEVCRTGEKIDETSKEMARARTQYESDISKAAHVREKWFAIQNNILAKQDDWLEVRGNIVESRAYLCDLLERKQKLRTENFKLKKRCRIMENKPLLRSFDQVVNKLQVIQQYIEKFKSI